MKIYMLTIHFLIKKLYCRSYIFEISTRILKYDTIVSLDLANSGPCNRSYCEALRQGVLPGAAGALVVAAPHPGSIPTPWGCKLLKGAVWLSLGSLSDKIPILLSSVHQ